MNKFKPMLASNIKIDNLKLPVIGSCKLEGVRGEFTPNGLFTRPMKRFNNSLLERKFIRILEFCKKYNAVVEGEFYVHGMDFSDISSICRRSNHPDTPLMQFHVFDLLYMDEPNVCFHDRIDSLNRYGGYFWSDEVIEVDQYYIFTHDQAHKIYEEAIANGYEGFVFKAPYEEYKFGRSTVGEAKFLRIKPEDTYDGIVVEIVERMENLVESKINELGYMCKTQDKDQKAHTGLAAVAIVISPDFPKPVRVSLSRGIKDYEDTKKSPSRKSIWDNREEYKGKNIKFVGLPVPGMDLPRAPRFDAWRTDLD
jgi:ATP-dependent DNA ligase